MQKVSWKTGRRTSKGSAAVGTFSPDQRAKLKGKLDGLVSRFDRRFLESDPLKFVHRYTDWRDQEIVGLLAAALAYGRVSIIAKTLEVVLSVLGPSPRRFVEEYAPTVDTKKFSGIKHRFNTGHDIALLCHLMGQVIRERGSLQALFLEGYESDQKTFAPALARFVAEILQGDVTDFYGDGRIPRDAAFRYLLSSPDNGSACKRMFLFLRWMIRDGDGVDLGAWGGLPASKLLVPLDTHVFRISRYLGLTSYRSASLKAAEEITANLALLDSKDPVRYDFALARLGILDICPKRLDPDVCTACDLYEVCQAK